MDFFNPNHWPMGAENIAKLCNVSKRTAQRWLSGKTRPPPAALKLIQLHQANRIIPDSWPEHWYINHLGALDIGHHARAYKPHVIEYALCKLAKYEP